MNALQRLIRGRMDQRHWSYADVAARGGLPRSTVHHLATNASPGRPPHPATLERLAAGLDIPLDTVRAAAAEAAGLAVWQAPSPNPDIEVLVAALPRLSPEDRRHVAALVNSLLGEVDSEGEQKD
ncbi:MAG: transcriptional regulator [Catenulispora sp. 13_1_20CM_3_70_7]|nr:MAG: transcriptional regulator [Catenulispora sp. 13_1_20CM_3_70_7]